MRGTPKKNAGVFFSLGFYVVTSWKICCKFASSIGDLLSVEVVL